MKKIIILSIILPIFTFAEITSNLKFGMKNTQVLELQSYLIDNGYLNKDSKTGYFGLKTLASVRKYQIAYKLPSTGYVGSMTRLAISKSKEIVQVEATSTVIATTTSVIEPVLSVLPVETPMQIVATPAPKVYNIIIMEETTPIYTIGTPQRVSRNTNGVDYPYVELPISFDASIMSSGNVAIVEGTITNDKGTQSAGNEFAFVPTSPSEFKMDLGDVYGVFNYTFTLKNNRGQVIYTNTDSRTIEQ